MRLRREVLRRSEPVANEAAGAYSTLDAPRLAGFESVGAAVGQVIVCEPTHATASDSHVLHLP